jgi:hypothetical protein
LPVIRATAPSIASIGPAGTQALTTTRPAGRRMRRISRSAPAGSPAKTTPKHRHHDVGGV